MMEQGALAPLVATSYPLAKIAEAHAVAEAGREQGSVVVTLRA